MMSENILLQFNPGEVFDKNYFRDVVHNIIPGYSESSITWLLGKLRKDNRVIAFGHGRYMKVDAEHKKLIYSYNHSKNYLQVEQRIATTYPLVDFQMWELIQWNEFLNHQIGRNAIVVEVENMLEDTVFDMLHSEFSDVMYKPTMDNFYRYRKDNNTIIVLRKISESPSSPHSQSCPLEKMLPDLFSNKFSGHIIEKSEYKKIFEDSFNKYYIDQPKMFRYARRRNLSERLRHFIEEETTITLLTDY